VLHLQSIHAWDLHLKLGEGTDPELEVAVAEILAEWQSPDFYARRKVGDIVSLLIQRGCRAVYVHTAIDLIKRKGWLEARHTNGTPHDCNNEVLSPTDAFPWDVFVNPPPTESITVAESLQAPEAIQEQRQIEAGDSDRSAHSRADSAANHPPGEDAGRKRKKQGAWAFDTEPPSDSPFYLYGPIEGTLADLAYRVNQRSDWVRRNNGTKIYVQGIDARTYKAWFISQGVFAKAQNRQPPARKNAKGHERTRTDKTFSKKASKRQT